MFQIGPREIEADLAFGVDLALFILQCRCRLEKQQLCTYSTLFCRFLCSHCTTTMCMKLPDFTRILCFVEDLNTRQRLPFSFSKLQYMSPSEFKSRKICQHLKFEAARINFSSQFFVAVAVVVA